MIDANIRKAAYVLHKRGHSERKIARTLSISRTAVRKAIRLEGKNLPEQKVEEQHLDEEHLRNLFLKCDGYVQRVHEILTEEGCTIAYSTLTEKIRKMGLRRENKKSKRCVHVPDVAGEEAQHDTTTYTVKLGEEKIKLVASLIYFRYSKVRYLVFYRSFDRFRMKCFLHEAHMHFGYSAKQIIIDNTNLARLSGSGYNAQMAPEMNAFSRQYGFMFVCHAINHPNRKAGNERAFWTIETSFFPGRTFKNLEDLNQQAFEWATVKMANRPQSGTGLIPAKTFEFEKSYLNCVAPEISAPYRPHVRKVNSYGYINFGTNFYWILEGTDGEVDVLEYNKYIEVYQFQKLISSYRMPADGVRKMSIAPDGHKIPTYKPSNVSRKGSAVEEQKLRAAMGQEVNSYIDFIKKRGGIQPNRLIRSLYRLSLKIETVVFRATIRRAEKYGITDRNTIERIAHLLIQEGEQPQTWTNESKDISDRPAYRAGEVTTVHPLEDYETLLNDDTSEQMVDPKNENNSNKEEI